MREPESPKLTTHIGDICICGDRRVLAGLDGVLFSGKTKCIKAHRVEHIASGHPLETAVDVGADVTQWVAHMESSTGGVRKHVENKQFLAALCNLGGISQRPGGIRGMECSLFLPVLLPAGLDLLGNHRGVAKWGSVGAHGLVTDGLIAHSVRQPTVWRLPVGWFRFTDLAPRRSGR